MSHKELGGLMQSTFEVRTGPCPESITDPDAGTVIATGPMATPTDEQYFECDFNLKVIASGSAGHFRIKGPSGECLRQGTVSHRGEGGDLQLDNVDLAPQYAETIHVVFQQMRAP